MGIDPSDERIEPFYNKMKELNMVMLLNIVTMLLNITLIGFRYY